MPGSDYSDRWNEARDGEEVDDFLDDLDEELDDIDVEEIAEKLRDRIMQQKQNQV